MTRASVKIGPQGRIVLPAAVRHELGLKEGDELLVLVEEGHIQLLTRDQLWAKIQARYKNVAPGRSLADELIAERRAEAKREEEES